MWLQHKYEMIFEEGDPRKAKVVERDDTEQIQLFNLGKVIEVKQKGNTIYLGVVKGSGGSIISLTLYFPDANLARAKAKRLQTVLLTTGELIT